MASARAIFSLKSENAVTF